MECVRNNVKNYMRLQGIQHRFLKGSWVPLNNIESPCKGLIGQHVKNNIQDILLSVLNLSLRKQLMANDSFLFLKAAPNNIAKAMDLWNVFASTSRLYINMRKSMPIRCIKSDLVNLGWSGQILDQGNVCRHLVLGICPSYGRRRLVELRESMVEDKE